MVKSQSAAPEKVMAWAICFMVASAGLALAQRLDSPDITVECERGANILKLCNSGCRAEEISLRGHRVAPKEREERLDRCFQGCWGIKMALSECPDRRPR